MCASQELANLMLVKLRPAFGGDVWDARCYKATGKNIIPGTSEACAALLIFRARSPWFGFADLSACSEKRIQRAVGAGIGTRPNDVVSMFARKVRVRCEQGETGKCL